MCKVIKPNVFYKIVFSDVSDLNVLLPTQEIFIFYMQHEILVSKNYGITSSTDLSVFGERKVIGYYDIQGK